MDTTKATGHPEVLSPRRTKTTPQNTTCQSPVFRRHVCSNQSRPTSQRKQSVAINPSSPSSLPVNVDGKTRHLLAVQSSLARQFNSAASACRDRLTRARESIAQTRAEVASVGNSLNAIDARVQSVQSTLRCDLATEIDELEAERQIDRYLERVIDKLLKYGRSIRLVVYYIDPATGRHCNPDCATRGVDLKYNRPRQKHQQQEPRTAAARISATAVNNDEDCRPARDFHCSCKQHVQTSPCCTVPSEEINCRSTEPTATNDATLRPAMAHSFAGYTNTSDNKMLGWGCAGMSSKQRGRRRRTAEWSVSRRSESDTTLPPGHGNSIKQ